MSATLTNATASTSTVSSESQQYIAAPSPVMTHTTRTVSGSRDPLDDFFGSTLRTHDSRHDERTQSLADVPPAYAEESAFPLPEYSLHAPEPVTLAMYLFKFGFCKFFFSSSSNLQAFFTYRSCSIPSFLVLRSFHPAFALA